MPDTITLPLTVVDLDAMPDGAVLLLAADLVADDVGTATDADRELGGICAEMFTVAAQARITGDRDDHLATIGALVRLARVAIRQEIDGSDGTEADRG